MVSMENQEIRECHFEAMAAIAGILEKADAMKPAKTQQQPFHRDALQSVSTLQAQTLSPSQLDAMAQVQTALRMIMELEKQVNATMLAAKLEVSPLMITQCGQLWHQFEGLLFSHNIASAKLRNGHSKVRKAA